MELEKLNLVELQSYAVRHFNMSEYVSSCALGPHQAIIVNVSTRLGNGKWGMTTMRGTTLASPGIIEDMERDILLAIVSQFGEEEPANIPLSRLSSYKPLIKSVEDEVQEESVKCELCDKDIQPYWAGTAKLTAVRIAEMTKNKHGQAMCSSCIQKKTSERLAK